MYKNLGIRFHRYFYGEGENIEFVDTEIPETGQRRDITVIVDGKIIRNTEFLSKPLEKNKLYTIYEYHDDLKHNVNYYGLSIISSIINTSKPDYRNHELKVDSNLTFHIETIFTQNRNEWEALSNLTCKTITQEELSDEEAIDLLILPDMDIEIPIKALMSMIWVLICNANIPDRDFKKNIIICEITVLNRFFDTEEISEMIKMLNCETENPKVARILEKYGPGFDEIYFDGKEDGINDGKLEVVERMLANGADEELISTSTGFSITQIKQIKRKL